MLITLVRKRAVQILTLILDKMSETNQPADDSPSNYSGTYIKAIEILGSREVEVLKEVAKAHTNRE